MTEITITQAERDALYFIPPAPGGIEPDEAIQLSLEAKGLASPRQPDGRRWLTILGDQVARNSSQLKIVISG